MNMMTSELPISLAPPIALLRALPPGPLAQRYAKLKHLADLFAAFDRDDMELGVELLLAQLDAEDGDPDREHDGDELDGDPVAEDEFTSHALDTMWGGPGCPLSECGVSEPTAAGDPAWIEWTSRGRHKIERYGGEVLARDAIGNIKREDDEDDGAPERAARLRAMGSAADRRAALYRGMRGASF